CQQESSWPLTF
nr:immunoglobulin light chain junction region [Macaca mulatta]MOX90969.1 immunoglobulin light chain junction region [Macaca mulatta]